MRIVVFRSSDSSSVSWNWAEGESEVRPAVIVDRRALSAHSMALDGYVANAWVTSAISETKTYDRTRLKHLLETPDQLQHEARGVADRIRHVARS